jgi:fluoroquinolone transport system permease protein
MVRLQTLRTLGALDAENLRADPMLRWMAILPLFVALAVRLALPLVVAKLAELTGVDLAWVQPYLAGYVVVTMAPLLAGAVVGFLLLDQRDDHTLLALRVTPLPLGAYLAYRLAAPVAVAVLATMASIGVGGGLGLEPALVPLAALATAPLAPLAALTLAAFARNKVQGLALMKAASVLLMAPLGALFMPDAWEAPLHLLPTYLIARTTWALQGGANALAYGVATWALCAALCALMLLRLRRTLGAG